MGSRQPPSTPSAHRFATKRDGTAAGRFQAPVAPTPSPLGPTERRPQQFATGPRFSFSSRPLKKSDQDVPSESTPAVPRGSALRHVFARAEPIEDTFRDAEQDERPGDAFVDDFEIELSSTRVHETSAHGSESHGTPEVDEDVLSDVQEQRYKRRRLSYPDIEIEPHASNHRDESRPRRFLPAKVIPALQHRTDPSSTVTDVPERARPSFILPTASHDHHAADDRPLPDVFSPHRKGQKFVPGGMAETVRGWVVDIASSASESFPGHSMSAGSYRSHGHGAIFQLRDVVLRNALPDPEIPPGAWMLVRGTLCDVNGHTRPQMILLAANAARRHAVRLLEDTVISISPPFLEVEVRDEMWFVAVEWSMA